MPCRVELTEAEREAERRARTDREIAKVVEPLQKRNDELTHENDMLREAVLALVERYKPTGDAIVPEELLKKIQKNQVEHRKEDLRRLEEFFLNEMWILTQKNGRLALGSDEMLALNAKLQAVRSADPNKPLESQLGFDPDEY